MRPSRRRSTSKTVPSSEIRTLCLRRREAVLDRERVPRHGRDASDPSVADRPRALTARESEADAGAGRARRSLHGAKKHAAPAAARKQRTEEPGASRTIPCRACGGSRSFVRSRPGNPWHGQNCTARRAIATLVVISIVVVASRSGSSRCSSRSSSSRFVIAVGDAARASSGSTAGARAAQASASSSTTSSSSPRRRCSSTSSCRSRSRRSTTRSATVPTSTARAAPRGDALARARARDPQRARQAARGAPLGREPPPSRDRRYEDARSRSLVGILLRVRGRRVLDLRARQRDRPRAVAGAAQPRGA